MSKIIYGQTQPEPEKYEAIKCMDHQVFIWSKSEIKKTHKGCDVRYCKKDGTPDD